MRRLGILVALVAVLASAPRAEADWRVRAAEAIAAQTWGPVCAGREPVVIVGRLDAFAPRLAGLARRSIGDGGASVCELRLSPWAMGAWWRLCTATVHEWGHLAGVEHSANPRSVMYPTIRRPFHRCHGTRP